MAGKQNWKVSFDVKNGIVKFLTRVDNQVRQQFSIHDVHEAHRDRILVRGLKVLLEERTSDVPGADIESKMAARQAVFELLQTERWSKERQGGGFTVGIHIEAIARIKGCTVGQAQDAYRKLDEDAQKALRASDAVKAVIAEIEEERGEVEEVDLSDLA